MGFGSEMGERKRGKRRRRRRGGWWQGAVGEDGPEQTAGQAANRPLMQGNVLDAKGYPHKTHPSGERKYASQIVH